MMELEKKNKLATIFFGLAWATLVAMFIYLIYPTDIIDIVQPYKILNENKQIKRGDRLIYEVSYVKHRDTPGIVYRNIVCEDGNLVTLAPFESNVPKGKYTLIREDVIIPAKTSTGMCKMTVVIDYEISHIKAVTYNLETEPFEVIE